MGYIKRKSKRSGERERESVRIERFQRKRMAQNENPNSCCNAKFSVSLLIGRASVGVVKF